MGEKIPLRWLKFEDVKRAARKTPLIRMSEVYTRLRKRGGGGGGGVGGPNTLPPPPPPGQTTFFAFDWGCLLVRDIGNTYSEEENKLKKKF